MEPILFATDGSPSALPALREALALAQAAGTSLVAVSVEHATIPPVGFSPYGYTELTSQLRAVEKERAERALADVSAAAKEAGVACRTLTPSGLIVDEILRAADHCAARMIVVGSHGWGATHRLVFGSVSEGVLRAARCPVLVVPGSERVAQEQMLAATAH